MSLQKEINARSKEIHTDGYPVSIGELIGMYRDGELDIHPEFQRFFRWGIVQKSKLIESLLLGIPIPSIFVSQREDGVWDVIDGLQRLSTILEFVGELKDEEKKVVKPSVLVGTDYLPSLEGKAWEDSDNCFETAQRLTLKRAKLDVKIVKKQSDKDAKYELFQRLNTGGSALSMQEVRNCLLVMVNKKFYKWLKDLASYPAFQRTISLSERLKEEQYHLELALRFFVYKSLTEEETRGIRDIGEFITEKMMGFAKDKQFPYAENTRVFHSTFTLLDSALADEAFTKYDEVKDRFIGAFSISAFEVIATGLGSNVDHYSGKDGAETDSLITSTVKEVWKSQTFKNHSGTGLRAGNRIPYLIPLGKKIFSHED